MEEVTEGQPEGAGGQSQAPSPADARWEDVRMLEGQLPGSQGSALPPTDTVPATFLWLQPTTWHQNPGSESGDMVTSLRSMSLGSSGGAQDRAASWGRGQGADIWSLGQKRDLANMRTNRTAAQGL